MGVIYLRTNLVNGMQYVGQTMNIASRERDWKNLDKKYSNSVITDARAEFGLDNFKMEIIKECKTRDELDEYERYYIKTLNTRYPNGYNMCDGGKGCSGWVMPENQKKKLSESRKGENNGMFGIKPWNTGKKMSKEFREAISRAVKGKLKGVPKTEEHKKKIGLAHSKAIVQIKEDGTVIHWVSASEAGRNGYNFSHICSCCRGERKRAHKCKWMYKEDYEKMLAEQNC